MRKGGKTEGQNTGVESNRNALSGLFRFDCRGVGCYSRCKGATVDFSSGRAKIVFDPGETDEETVREKITAAGFGIL